MEQLAPAVDKVQHLAKSTHDFLSAAVLRLAQEASARPNPIEILKRLQLEAFSDLVKLWDRQAKGEKPVSIPEKSEGTTSTLFRGELDFLATALFVGDSDGEHSEQIERAEFRTGVGSRFVFETKLRGKDSLFVELIADRSGKGFVSDEAVSSISLSKLFYEANFCGWLSGVAIPVGAQFRDVSITKNCSSEGIGLMGMSSFGPPLLNQHNGSAIGLMVRKSNVTASLARSISGMGMPFGFDGIRHWLCTFAQVVYQLPKGTKFSLMGVHEAPRSLSHNLRLGPFVLPVGFLRHREVPETMMEAPSSSTRTNSEELFSKGTIAVRLESGVDEYRNLEAWMQMENFDPLHLRWAINVSDRSDANIGWGLSIGGIVDGPVQTDQVQVESYLKFNMGKNFSLKPGVAYVMDGSTGTVAVMLRSNWSM